MCYISHLLKGRVISQGKKGILYHERVHLSRTCLIQDAEKLFWPIKLRQFVICGTPGEQSSRMLKKAVQQGRSE
jgi:hypothetical protein